jgi:hypothetical protein
MSLLGRPRVLDDGKRREVCALISAGCNLEAAARYVNCSTATIRREAIRNEHFREELRAAEVRAQLDPLRAMRKAANTHWRAAAWLLERTNPRQFARQKTNAWDPRELHDVVNAIVERAGEEIAEPETRDRVCRQLLAAAYRASRSLDVVDRSRPRPRVNALDRPLTKDERELRVVMDELESAHQASIDLLRRDFQKPASNAGPHSPRVPAIVERS